MADQYDKKQKLNRLHHAFIDAEIEEVNSRESFMVARGIDLDELVEGALFEIKKRRLVAKAAENEQKDIILLQTALSRIKEKIEENATKTMSILKEMLTSRGASYQFRNLEKDLDTEDLREILSEIDLVELMEELDE
jgi:hypothetical protein